MGNFFYTCSYRDGKIYISRNQLSRHQCVMQFNVASPKDSNGLVSGLSDKRFTSFLFHIWAKIYLDPTLLFTFILYCI